MGQGQESHPESPSGKTGQNLDQMPFRPAHIQIVNNIKKGITQTGFQNFIMSAPDTGSLKILKLTKDLF